MTYQLAFPLLHYFFIIGQFSLSLSLSPPLIFPVTKSFFLLQLNEYDSSDDSKDLEIFQDEKLNEVEENRNEKFPEYESLGEPDKTGIEIDEEGEEDDEIERLLRPKPAKPKLVDRDQPELEVSQPSPSSKIFEEEKLMRISEEGSGDYFDFGSG